MKIGHVFEGIKIEMEVTDNVKGELLRLQILVTEDPERYVDTISQWVNSMD